MPLLPFRDPTNVLLPERSRRILKCLDVRSNDLVASWNTIVRQMNALIRLHPMLARVLVRGFGDVLRNTVTDPIAIRPVMSRLGDKMTRLALRNPAALARFEADLDAALRQLDDDDDRNGPRRAVGAP